MRAIVVDDEELGRNLIRNMLKKHPHIAIVGECTNGIDALNSIQELDPDFIFLDIKMPGMDGLKLAEKLPQSDLRKIVFITAYNQYALQAFENNAIDYLLKPFDQDRFDHTISRLTKNHKLHKDAEFANRIREVIRYDSKQEISPIRLDSQSKATETTDRIVVKENGRIYFIPTEEVDYFEASGNYVAVHHKGRTYLVYKSLTKMEHKLDCQKFLRIHRSIIVNIKSIKEMEPYTNGEFVVKLKDNTTLKLSRSYREAAKKLLCLD